MPKVIDLPTASSMDDSDYLLMEESTGGTKKITKSNALKNIGVVVRANTTLNSISSETYTNLASLTLSAGKYIVVGQARWQGGENTQNIVSISTASQTVQPEQAGFAQFASNSSTLYVAESVTRILDLSSTTTIYLVGYQTSGSAKNIVATSQCSLHAIRIS